MICLLSQCGRSGKENSKEQEWSFSFRKAVNTRLKAQFLKFELELTNIEPEPEYRISILVKAEHTIPKYII